MRTLGVLGIVGIALGIGCGVFGAPIEVTAVSFTFGVAMFFAFGHAMFEAFRTEAPEPYDLGEVPPHIAPAPAELELSRKDRGTIESKKSGAF